MMDNDDLSLQALLSVRAELAPDIDEQIIRQCYVIQKKHQFDREPSLSLQAMDRLVDEHVNKLAEKGTDAKG